MLTHPCRTIWKHDFVCCCQTCLHVFSLLLTQFLQLCNPRQKFSLHILMMCWQIMLCKIICQVCFTRLPISLKLSLLYLLYSIQQPFESHIHQYCLLWLDMRIHYPLRRQVICLDRSSRLGVAHLLQYFTQMHSLFGINV
jgi:hypothetical protein